MYTQGEKLKVVKSFIKNIVSPAAVILGLWNLHCIGI